MTTSVLSSALIFQPDAINSGNSQLLMIFVGLCAVALLGQAIALIAIAVIASKVTKTVLGQIDDIKAKTFGHVDDIKAKALPLVEKVSGIVGDVRPQVATISEQAKVISVRAQEITTLVRDKVTEFGPTVSAIKETIDEANDTAREANQKTREQVSKVNTMVSDVLFQTANVGKSVKHTVTQPGREVAGIINGLKVGFTTLFNGRARSKRPAYKAPSGVYEPATPGSGYPASKPDLEP